MKTVASYASSIAPGYVMELATALHDAAEPLITTASGAAGAVFEKAAPLAGDGAKAFAEAIVAASTAALATAIRIFTEVEAFAMKEAGKVEALEPHVTPTTVRAVTALVFGVPAAWALAKAASASGRIFGRRMRRVPKSVAQTSVPLRTPTPEVCEARGQDAVFAQAGRSVQVARRGRAEVRLKAERAGGAR